MIICGYLQIPSLINIDHVHMFYQSTSVLILLNRNYIKMFYQLMQAYRKEYEKKVQTVMVNNSNNIYQQNEQPPLTSNY